MGELKEGVPKGLGFFKDVEGNFVVGELKDGSLGSMGAEFLKDGTCYITSSRNGMTMTPDGQLYIGEYENENMSGSGLFKDGEGTTYIGEWRNNNMNGKGLYMTPDGINVYGTFINGEADGPCFMVGPDGIVNYALFDMGKYIRLISSSVSAQAASRQQTPAYRPAPRKKGIGVMGFIGISSLMFGRLFSDLMKKQNKRKRW